MIILSASGDKRVYEFARNLLAPSTYWSPMVLPGLTDSADVYEDARLSNASPSTLTSPLPTSGILLSSSTQQASAANATVGEPAGVLVLSGTLSSIPPSTVPALTGSLADVAPQLVVEFRKSWQRQKVDAGTSGIGIEPVRWVVPFAALRATPAGRPHETLSSEDQVHMCWRLICNAVRSGTLPYSSVQAMVRSACLRLSKTKTKIR